MKTKITTISIFLLLYIFTSISPQKAAAQGASVSFQIFYDELSPYGSWINSPDYGYVWVPNVEPGFSPYETNGYWILTDDGWTWVSNYPWGWAPFHYGRWYTDNLYGPIWVPGYEWGPGWVSWRRSDDYYGWAPMGPGISINIGYGEGYNERYNHYTFMPCGYLGRRNISRYFINHRDNDSYFRRTSGFNNSRFDKRYNDTYHAGPDRAEVEKRSGRKFSPVPISDNNKPGQNVSKKQLQIYRPRVQQNISNEQKSAPNKVDNLQNVKPAAQRTSLPTKQQINQPVKQQQNQIQLNGKQPNKQQQWQPTQKANQPVQQQKNVQPAKQQWQPMQKANQPVQQQKNVQPAKQQWQQPKQQQHQQAPLQQQQPKQQQHQQAPQQLPQRQQQQSQRQQQPNQPKGPAREMPPR